LAILPLFLCIVLIPNSVFSECIATPCYVLSFKTIECQFKLIDNHSEIDQMIQGTTDLQFRGTWESKKASISGLALKVVPIDLTPVECGPDGKIEIDTAGSTDFSSFRKLFYPTELQDACSKFVGVKTEKYVPERCCDTAPREGFCLSDAPIVKDVPEFITLQRTK
jgi:hypothetical protein